MLLQEGRLLEREDEVLEGCAAELAKVNGPPFSPMLRGARALASLAIGGVVDDPLQPPEISTNRRRRLRISKTTS